MGTNINGKAGGCREPVIVPHKSPRKITSTSCLLKYFGKKLIKGSQARQNGKPRLGRITLIFLNWKSKTRFRESRFGEIQFSSVEKSRAFKKIHERKSAAETTSTAAAVAVFWQSSQTVHRDSGQVPC